MVIGNTMPYVYGAYLMSPHRNETSHNGNKNSFGRLINSYYGKHSLFKKTLQPTSPTGLLAVNDQAKELKTFAESLYEATELYEDGREEELEAALFTFVSEYNALRTSLTAVDYEEFQERGSVVDLFTRSQEETLSSIGIQCEEDGTLTIGENGLTVEHSDTVKELFQGEDSFAAQLCSKAGTLGQEALSLFAPMPKFYGESGNIQFVIYAGTLFSTSC